MQPSQPHSPTTIRFVNGAKPSPRSCRTAKPVAASPRSQAATHRQPSPQPMNHQAEESYPERKSRQETPASHRPQNKQATQPEDQPAAAFPVPATQSSASQHKQRIPTQARPAAPQTMRQSFRSAAETLPSARQILLSDDGELPCRARIRCLRLRPAHEDRILSQPRCCAFHPPQPCSGCEDRSRHEYAASPRIQRRPNKSNQSMPCRIRRSRCLQINLRHRIPFHGAGILHIRLHRQRLARCQLRRRQFDVAPRKVRIAQPIAKSPQRHAREVAIRPLRHRVVIKRRQLVRPRIERHRQPSRQDCYRPPAYWQSPCRPLHRDTMPPAPPPHVPWPTSQPTRFHSSTPQPPVCPSPPPPPATVAAPRQLNRRPVATIESRHMHRHLFALKFRRKPHKHHRHIRLLRHSDSLLALCLDRRLPVEREPCPEQRRLVRVFNT